MDTADGSASPLVSPLGALTLVGYGTWDAPRTYLRPCRPPAPQVLRGSRSDAVRSRDFSCGADTLCLGSALWGVEPHGSFPLAVPKSHPGTGLARFAPDLRFAVLGCV